MGLTDAEQLWQVKHRRLLYQFYRACLRDDQTSLAAVRQLAEKDPKLARAIERIEQALARRRHDPLEHHESGVTNAMHGIPELPLAPSEQPDSSQAESDSARPFTTPHDQLPDVSDTAPEVSDVPAALDINSYEYRLSRQIFAERTGADYSAMVDRKLSASFDRLELGKGDYATQAKALDLADTILKERMAPAQRLRVLHFCATLACNQGDFERALGYVEDSLAIAMRTGTPSVQIYLLDMRGGIHRNMSHLRQAIEDFRTALELYHNLPDETHHSLPALPTVEVAILVKLANLEFFLALYPAAERHAAEATTKLASLPNASVFAASLEWLRALLYRWRGQPELALRPALQALELLQPGGDTSALGRLQSVIASITLDMAEHVPEGTVRLAFARMASSHCDSALQLASECDDKEALALAQIEDVRYSRLCGTNRARVSLLEAVRKWGEDWGDPALLAQAFTALAQEMSNRKEPERALNLYRKALTLTQKSDLPALGVWAQRAILRASEMRGIP